MLTLQRKSLYEPLNNLKIEIMIETNVNVNTVWSQDPQTGKMVPDDFYNNRIETVICHECGSDLTNGSTHYSICSQSEI